jgi:N-ethylmaleimide reductase
VLTFAPQTRSLKSERTNDRTPFHVRCVLFDQLFQPLVLGGQTLPNRLVLPPLTRSRAEEDGVPTPLMAEYYRQRAGAGLVISEGTVVSPQGASYARVPGLYSAEQVAGWRPVVAAAKSRGAAVYAQLWHVGRQAHSSVQPDGTPPWAPSPVAITGWQYRSPHGRIPFEVPRQLSEEGIAEIVAQFATAARNAVSAGFDGVELHAANGYLFDQFLNSSANRRSDRYGGSTENRLRFLHEVIDAVSAVIPASRIGVRISPSSTWMDVFDPDKRGLYSALVRSVSERGLAYLHLVEPGIAGSLDARPDAETIESAELGGLFDGPVIVTGGHTPDTAAAAVSAGDADLVGFGRLFIANPDLPRRIRTGAELTGLRHEGLYGGGPAGYTDYPELQSSN